MEVEELIPLARCHFSLTPSTGAVEEDNGFVDILETDLKENDVVPPGMESLISAPLVKTSEKEEEQVSPWRDPSKLGSGGALPSE